MFTLLFQGLKKKCASLDANANRLLDELKSDEDKLHIAQDFR